MLLQTGWILFLLCLVNRFAENTGKLQVHHIHVPDPFILGSSSDLLCNYSWTHPEQEARPIYSIKWYKENAEFFRFVPSEEPDMVSFDKDGIFVDINRSSPQKVHLKSARWSTAGKFRCEVTADDFETASKSGDATVVAVPKSDPYIEGNKHKYSPGELVELNCTSNSSDPEADLFWYINALPAGEDMLVRYPRIREPTNLLTSILGLRFYIGSQHMRASIVRVKCTAMLLTVYLKSNEITFEVKRPQKLPALESRENRRGGALGSASGNGPADLAGNIAGGADSSGSEADKDKETNVKAADPGPYFGFGISRSSANIRSSLWLTGLSAWLVGCLTLWFNAKCP